MEELPIKQAGQAVKPDGPPQKAGSTKAKMLRGFTGWGFYSRRDGCRSGGRCRLLQHGEETVAEFQHRKFDEARENDAHHATSYYLNQRNG